MKQQENDQFYTKSGINRILNSASNKVMQIPTTYITFPNTEMPVERSNQGHNILFFSCQFF